MINDKLNKLKSELIEKYYDINFPLTAKDAKLVEIGFDAAVTAMQELKAEPSAVAFDEFNARKTKLIGEQLNEVFNNSFHVESFVEGAKYQHQQMAAQLDKLRVENKELKSIIAKEMSENDEFGAEYVHVSILKDQLSAAQAEVRRLREVVSYLPKVPTQPYEKELAKQVLSANDIILELEKALQYYADHSPIVDIYHSNGTMIPSSKTAKIALGIYDI